MAFVSSQFSVFAAKTKKLGGTLGRRPSGFLVRFNFKCGACLAWKNPTTFPTSYKNKHCHNHNRNNNKRACETETARRDGVQAAHITHRERPGSMAGSRATVRPAEHLPCFPWCMVLPPPSPKPRCLMSAVCYVAISHSPSLLTLEPPPFSRPLFPSTPKRPHFLRCPSFPIILP